MEKLKDLMNMETVHVAMEFWKEHGLKALVVKSKHKLQGIDNDYDYSEWYELTKPTDEELAEQRKHIFDFEPMLSVVIPAYKTPERYLREMLDSIMEQTYTNWEICVADGSPRGEDRNVCLRSTRTVTGVCAMRFWAATAESQAIPMQPWIWPGETLSSWLTMTIHFLPMLFMRW